MVDRPALVVAARNSIARGSKSFAMASRLFAPQVRERAWLLYAWCRACDDIADGQEHGHGMSRVSDAQARIERIQTLTDLAYSGEATGEMPFDALAVVARECAIPKRFADDVIAGFRLDAEGWQPQSEDDLYRYCYHVAGAVGCMMAVVMGVPRDDEPVLDRACDLGLAFQLANIARDVVEDDAAGRCYLPAEWLVEEDIEPGQHTKPHHRQELADMAARLVRRMEVHAKSSRIGASRLPFRSRWAILSAARIYTAIGREVLAKGRAAWDHRVYTSKAQKIGHALAAFFEALVNRPPALDDEPRWRRADLA